MDVKETSGTLHFAACTGDKNMLKKLLEDLPYEELEAKDELGQTPLFCSIACNNVECASLLLKQGALADSADNTGQTALHVAINKDLHRCVKLLLADGAVWYQKDLEGVTALHAAAVAKSSKCLSSVLNVLKPAEIDMQDGLQKTALHWSSSCGHVDNVNLLLSKGANISIPDNEGKTPIHWSVTNPNPNALDCLKILLEKDPYAINWQDYMGRTALHIAVLSGSNQMVDHLTSRPNCNIDMVDNMFCTPLHLAAREGLEDKIALLLSRGASYKSADCNGATPLHYAVHNNQVRATEKFLCRIYVEDVPDIFGHSALHWAAAGSVDNVIKVMAKYNTDFAIKDKNGETALHAAALFGNISTIKILLKCGAPINAVDNNGVTPLSRACEYGRLNTAQYLINRGADLLCADHNGRNCLHWAARNGHAYVCQVLFQCNPRLHNGDIFGMTPLHYTSSKGFINCVSVFLENGINPNVPDLIGKTALHLASFGGHADVAKLLYDYGAFVNVLTYSKSWFTPLDHAVFNETTEIIHLLESIGGLTAFDIQTLAVKKIQKWFRRKMCNERYREKCTKAIDWKPEINLKLKKITIVNNSGSSHNFRSSLLPLQEQNEPSNEFQDIRSNIACPQTTTITKDQAARIIQKAWKKFFFKRCFSFMKQKIERAFPSEESLEAAEKAWAEQLKQFLNKLS